jgi:hypothetical protein
VAFLSLLAGLAAVIVEASKCSSTIKEIKGKEL